MSVVTITRQSLNPLLPQRSPEEWEAMRADLLTRGYTTCSVAGCGALVGPSFQRDVPGLGRVALCPRTAVHVSRLGPARHTALLAAFRAAASSPAPTDSPEEAGVVELEKRRTR